MNAPYHNKALPAGTILREWRLEEVLGVGGFGIVYRGKDVYFGETVAIKEYFPSSISDRLDGTTVAPTDSSSEEIYQLGRQKFLEEAKVLWNLSRPERHPNLVGVRSLFEIHGTAYMVMDFENGVSLSQMLHEGKTFDEKGLMALIRPIAEGLEKAHTAGVLHRDIKPANILVNQEGRPVLIDFGSARFESGQATNTKVTFYTPPYAAIEQYVKSYAQGPWTDIYALGVVMYQCVTGEKPPEVLERMHGEADQPLSEKSWPGYSRAFTRAIDAAMGIRPIERPQSISAWLKLFDAAEAPVDNEATRIGAPIPAEQSAAVPRPAPVAAAPTPVSKPATPPSPPTLATQIFTAPAPVPSPVPAMTASAAAAAPRPPPAKSRKTTQIILGSLAALVVLAGAGAVLTFSHHASAPAAAPQAAPVAAAVQPKLGELLGGKMDALLAAAAKVNRPQSEIASLTDAKAKLVALAASIKDSAKPDPTAQGQLSDAAHQLFHDETALLARTEKRQWNSVSVALDTAAAPGAAQSVASLGQAKTNLDASLTADQSKADAAKAIDATSQALANFSTFENAYGVAAPYYVAAKRKQFAALYSGAQALSAQMVALANVSKPWFLASSARKKAYQLRQDNEAKAKSLMAPLDALSTSVPKTSEITQLDSALAQATTVKKTLTDLVAASTAATL